MEKIYDVIIIGSGPAGLSASIYAARGGLDFIVIEANFMSGGQILTTSEVDNYLGLYNVNGFDMGMKFREHAEKLGTKFVNTTVTKIEDGEVKVIECEDGSRYKTNHIVVATGAKASELNVTGEREFIGKGVSYCATCDGNFFKDKEVAVIGGGDTALEDALYLARICKKVYVIHRRDSFRGAKSLADRLLSCENVEIIWNTVVEEIIGSNVVESLIVRNVSLDMPGRIDVAGVFVAIGRKPQTAVVKGIVKLDEYEYVLADENCRTDKKGIYAAGDIRQKEFRQIITAASDGANAINSILKDKAFFE